MNTDIMVSLAQEAGRKVMEIYSQDFSHWKKKDQSPLTDADVLAHRIIIEGLKEAFPNIPALSEEGSSIDYEKRKDWGHYFLIDPIDGTKEFIKKNDEFTVNIAYMENGVPVVGVIYVPAEKKTYYNDMMGDAYLLVGEVKSKLPLHAFDESHLKVLISHSHSNRTTEKEVEKMTSMFEKVSIKPMGSSLKMCKIAEGSADFYPRLKPTMEWDTAAAQAIINATGGLIVDYLTGKQVTYNKKCLKNNSFIVARREMKDIAYRVVAS
jgi:3'(2'), 5'-bisphosphate nucleotidase